jgi:hypothetical protein
VLRPALPAFAVLSVQHDRDRAVVGDLDEHAGAERAPCDLGALPIQGGAERLVDGRRLLRAGGVREARPVALPRVREKRELAYDERLAGRVDEAPVELALLALEDPQARRLAREARGGLLVVPLGDPEEDAEPRADGRDRLSVDEDARLPDPLDDRSQFSRASSARW